MKIGSFDAADAVSRKKRQVRAPSRITLLGDAAGPASAASAASVASAASAAPR